MNAPAGDRGGSQPYRPDIDGLRAIAVLSVIVFHAGLPVFSGGFVGVDIFFVISGYLIAQILLRDVEARKFSIVTFYERRVRRIVPALMVMMLATVLVAATFMMLRDFKELGESALAATTFLSNVYFYLRADYFDTSALYKPLLHTWSLAVEEQYYLVFPVLLWAFARTIGRFTFWAFALIALGSFAFGVYQTGEDPTGAFYLPFSRLWELLLGALLAMRPMAAGLGARARNGLAWLGLALILVAIFALNERMPFPGAAALLPCIGSALILGAHSNGAVARLLSTPLMRGVGLISYSLYLWHWPIISLLNYYFQREVPILGWAVAMVGLFAISYLSWRFVETPVRVDRALFTRGRVFVGAAVASAAFIAFGVVDFKTRGLPQRFPADVNALASATYDVNPETCDQRTVDEIEAGDICLIGAESGEPSFVLMGDSMAHSAAPGVARAAREAGRRGAVLTYSGCYSFLDTRQNTDFCSHRTRAVVDYIERTPSISTIIMINRWSSAAEASRYGEDEHLNWNFIISDAYSEETGPAENARVLARALGRTLDALEPRRIVLVAFAPEQAFNVPRRLGLQKLLGQPLQPGVPRAVFDQRQAKVRAILDESAETHAFELIDLTDTFCDDAYCRVLSADGAPLYSDDNHLSQTGAVSIAPILGRAFEPVQNPR